MNEAELVDANVDIVTDSKEGHGVLKPNELSIACMRPYNLWNYGEEENVAALAVSLLPALFKTILSLRATNGRP